MPLLPIKGATAPNFRHELEDPADIAALEQAIAELSINNIRFRVFPEWLPDLQQILNNLPDGVRVSVILSHRRNENCVITPGLYPRFPAAACQELRNKWLPLFANTPAVWGFDVRAEPYLKDGKVLYDHNGAPYTITSQESWTG